MSDPRYDPKMSSVKVGGEKKKRGLLPLILGLLLLLILIALIVGLVSCGDDDDSDSASTPSTPTATASTPSASTPSTPAVPAATATLTAGDDDVIADTAKITDHVGDPATGADLKVLSVVGSGFFVGTGEEDRQYVEYGGEVGEDEADVELPAVGDTVGLKGEVRPAPEDPAQTLKLEEADAQLVVDRGAYVNATSVTPAP